MSTELKIINRLLELVNEAEKINSEIQGLVSSLTSKQTKGQKLNKGYSFMRSAINFACFMELYNLLETVDIPKKIQDFREAAINEVNEAKNRNLNTEELPKEFQEFLNKTDG